MDTLRRLSSHAAAEKLTQELGFRVAKYTVRRWAVRLGLGKIAGGVRWFTRAEVKRLAASVHEKRGNRQASGSRK